MSEFLKAFYVEFCRATPYLSFHSDIVRVSEVLGVASQMSKLWQNDMGSPGKPKPLKRDMWVFLYTPKM